MSQPRRVTGAPQQPDDELAALIRSALHHRVASAPDPADVAADLTDALTHRPPAPTSALRRGGRVAVAGAVTGALAVAASGAAAAANPYSGVAVAVESAAQSVGLEWSFMPLGFTREQYDALASSGLTPDDVRALSELWQADGTDLKARIGQAILDGEVLPVAPGTSAPGAQYDAFWAAGYTEGDLEALNDLWGTDWAETKLRAGQALLDGELLPLRPSGTPPIRLHSSAPGEAPPAEDLAPAPSRPDAPFTARPDAPVPARPEAPFDRDD